jgi:hypothetical protein
MWRVFPQSRAGIGKRQHIVEVCNFVDAGTSIALWAQAREDFHEQTAIEAVISFLQTYGCPHQMTFDRDPTLGGECVWSGFSLSVASALVVLGDHAPYLSAASTRQKRVSCILHSFRTMRVYFDICEHSSQEHAHQAAETPPSHDH